jgi:hypothetical protein
VGEVYHTVSRISRGRATEICEGAGAAVESATCKRLMGDSATTLCLTWF